MLSLCFAGGCGLKEESNRKTFLSSSTSCDDTFIFSPKSAERKIIFYCFKVTVLPFTCGTLDFVKSNSFLVLLSASPYSGSTQRESIFHLSRSTSSPSLAPTLSTSFLAKSIHLLFGLPLFLLPGTAISIIVFPT